jgi:hypothetical protein
MRSWLTVYVSKMNAVPTNNHLSLFLRSTAGSSALSIKTIESPTLAIWNVVPGSFASIRSIDFFKLQIGQLIEPFVSRPVIITGWGPHELFRRDPSCSAPRHTRLHVPHLALHAIPAQRPLTTHLPPCSAIFRRVKPSSTMQCHLPPCNATFCLCI